MLQSATLLPKSGICLTHNQRTMIAIAHRLSTIRNADCIYVMEYGELVESGTYEDKSKGGRIDAGDNN